MGLLVAVMCIVLLFIICSSACF